MRRQRERVHGDEQRTLLRRAIKCYPHVGRKKPSPSSSRRSCYPLSLFGDWRCPPGSVRFASGMRFDSDPRCIDVAYKDG
jgi:hypothetical protein